MSKPVLAYFPRRSAGYPSTDLDFCCDLRAEAGVEVVVFASGRDVAKFRAKGVSVREIQASESTRQLDFIVKAGEMLSELKPNAAVARDSFGAIVAAKMSGVPVLFLGAISPPPGTILSESLRYADRILVESRPGLLALGVGLPGSPRYIGPVISMAHNERRPNPSASVEGALRITVFGGALSETRVAAMDTILSAFMRLQVPNKTLTWVAGDDFKIVSDRARGIKGIEVVEDVDSLPGVVRASDLVLSKADRDAVLQSALCGTRSISLSVGTSVLDDFLFSRIANNYPLNFRACDSEVLLCAMEELLNSEESFAPPSQCGAISATEAGRILAEEIGALLARPGVAGGPSRD